MIVTSGTAVANLYPALIEAGLTGEKLILLTADRPPELIDCGANQAIRQPGMFASHPTHSISLPRPTQDIPARWLVSTIDHAPVRFMLVESISTARLLNRCAAKWTTPGLAGNSGWATGGMTTNRGCVKRLVWKRKNSATGSSGDKSAAWWLPAHECGRGQKVALWAQTLGWPLIGDVLSQTGQPLPCADLWLGNAKATSELQQAQIVVQLGSSLTGKRLLQWQASCEPEEYWIVDDIEGRLDPAHHRGRRLIANIADWLEQHPAEKRQPWCVEIPRLAEQAMQAVIARRDAFGEAQLAHRISDYLPGTGAIVCR